MELTTIENIDFREACLEEDYYKCRFVNCRFDRITLLQTDFTDCEFLHCDFTMTEFKNSVQDVRFKDCQLMGSNFSEMNRLSHGLAFYDCHMDYVLFIETRLPKVRFENCSLLEASFDKSDLKLVVFYQCNLERATFNGCHLYKTDFSSAYNYTIEPEHCFLKKTIFSYDGLEGLVRHLDIELV